MVPTASFSLLGIPVCCAPQPTSKDSASTAETVRVRDFFQFIFFIEDSPIVIFIGFHLPDGYRLRSGILKTGVWLKNLSIFLIVFMFTVIVRITVICVIVRPLRIFVIIVEIIALRNRRLIILPV